MLASSIVSAPFLLPAALRRRDFDARQPTIPPKQTASEQKRRPPRPKAKEHAWIENSWFDFLFQQTGVGANELNFACEFEGSCLVTNVDDQREMPTIIFTRDL